MDKFTVDRSAQARLESDPVLLAAAEWFLELRSSGVSVERIAEWQEWLAADAANRQAFDRIESLWHMTGKIAAPSWPADTDVAADSYRGVGTISEWRRHPAHRRLAVWPHTFRFAAVVLAAAIGLWLWLRAPLIAVETAVGETRNLSLPDGSTIAVGGYTEIEADFVERSRDVALTRGEAFFRVAKDPARPFVVHAGRIAVTAVGTAFNVRRAAHGVTMIAVAEGTVKITTPNREVGLVSAGQEARVMERAGERAAVVPVNASSVAGWRDGRLQYINESLQAVIADLRRYSSRKIVIGDSETGELRITGIVFQQNVDGWLASLEATLPVRVVHGENGTAEIRRRESEQ